MNLKRVRDYCFLNEECSYQIAHHPRSYYRGLSIWETNPATSSREMYLDEVFVLVYERMEAGVHELKFDGSGLAGGVYLYRLQAGDFIRTRKLLIMLK